MSQRINYTTVAPAGLEAFMSVHNYVAHSGLRKALLDLVYLRVSQINGCAYCIDMHSRDLLKDGFTVDKLVLVPIWREAEAMFSSRERAALAWSETVTRVADTAVPEDEYKHALSEFTEKELVDLTFAIGLMNALNRVAISFRATPLAVQTVAAAK